MLSITGAFRHVVDFLGYVTAREELGHEEHAGASAARSAPSLAGWIAAREELGEDGSATRQGRSFLGWLAAREPLGVEDRAPAGAGATDEEAADE